MDLLTKLREASVFKAPSGADITKRKEARQKQLGTGEWVAEVYHKRVYLRLHQEDMDAIKELAYQGFKKSLPSYKPEEFFSTKIKYKTKHPAEISADQASGTVKAPNGEEFEMDVNWEVLAEDVPAGVNITGEVTLDQSLEKEDLEAIAKYKTFQEYDNEHATGCTSLMYDLDSDAAQKYYTKEGPGMFKDWLEDEGGDSPNVKVTGPITVKYVGESPQIEEQRVNEASIFKGPTPDDTTARKAEGEKKNREAKAAAVEAGRRRNTATRAKFKGWAKKQGVDEALGEALAQVAESIAHYFAEANWEAPGRVEWEGLETEEDMKATGEEKWKSEWVADNLASYYNEFLKSKVEAAQIYLPEIFENTDQNEESTLYGIREELREEPIDIPKGTAEEMAEQIFSLYRDEWWLIGP